MKTNFPDRSFQLWEYNVSHGCMLIRSPKRAGYLQNIDIMFAGVEYASLPRHIKELEIDVPQEMDISFAQLQLGREVDAKKVIVLRSGNHRYIVVAATVSVTENTMDIFQSPFG